MKSCRFFTLPRAGSAIAAGYVRGRVASEPKRALPGGRNADRCAEECSTKRGGSASLWPSPPDSLRLAGDPPANEFFPKLKLLAREGEVNVSFSWFVD